MSIFDPVEALQLAFGKVFSGIAEAIAAIPGQVISGVTAAVNGLVSSVSSALAALPGQIFNQLLNIKDQILGGLAGIPGKVAGLLGGIEAAVSNAFTGFSDQVIALFSGIGTQIRNFISPILGQVQTSVTSGFSNLQNSFSGFPSFVDSLIRDTNTKIAEFEKNVSSQINADLTLVANIGSSLTANLNNLQDNLKGFGDNFNKAFQGLGQFGQQIFQAFTQGAKALYDATIQPIVTGFSTAITTVATTITNLTKGVENITPNQAIALASTAGAAITTILAARWGIDAAVKAATFGQVKVLDKQLTEVLEAIGIVGLGAKFNLAPIDNGILPLLKRGWRSIFTPEVPGVGELLEMADRGAFDGSGLIRAPAQTLQYIKENGLSSFWADKLWTIHFQPLGLGQIGDALHRELIDIADFQRRLDLLAVYPGDKQILQQLAFTFPGIRQMRALAKLGLLSDKQIEDAVNAAGLREDYRAPFIKSLQEANLLPLLDRLDSTALAAYEDFLISDTDLANLLQQSRKPKEVIEQELKLAQFKRQLAYKKAQIAVITTLLKKGILMPQEALVKYQEIGLDTDRAMLFVSLAQYELDAAASKKLKKAAPDLSVSQIQKALKIGDITTDDAFAAFTARGYDTNEARTLVELTFGSDSVPVLTVGQILAAMKKAIITVEDAAKRILQRGYSQVDTTILIATAMA